MSGFVKFSLPTLLVVFGEYPDKIAASVALPDLAYSIQNAS